MVAPFAKTSKANIKVAVELILCFLMIHFGDLIFNLNHLNPTNMLASSI